MGNKKMMLLAAFLAVIACMFGTFLFLNTITSGNWQEERDAVKAAFADTMLAKADKVEPFVGHEPYMIVFGEDKIGHKMIVWVSQDERHAAYESEGISKEAVTAKVTAADSANKVIRATPGKLDAEYVWEVYYERAQEDGVHRFYDYYRFSDGALLDTLRL